MTVDRSRYSAENCSVSRALEIIGDKWTLHVLREAYYGIRRFKDFQDAIGCAKNVLSDRLAKLEAHEMLKRVPYREDGQRERFEYRLTERSRDLFPVVVALMNWGDRWLNRDSGPPVRLHHADCGRKVRASLVCTAGHADISLKQTRAGPGPGAKLKAGAAPARQSRR